MLNKKNLFVLKNNFLTYLASLALLLFISSFNLSFAETSNNSLNLFSNQEQTSQASSWISDANSNSNSNSNSDFANQQEFLSAEEAFIPDILQDANSLDLIFNVSDHYYLYKDSIKITQKTTGDLLQLNFPKAEDKTDEHYGATKIYRQMLSFNIDKNQLPANSIWQVKYQGCADAGLCYPPQTKFLQVDANKIVSLTSQLIETSPQPLVKQAQISQTDLNSNSDEKVNGAYADEYSTALANKGLLSILAIFFAGGLLLAFTPCVLPMLPIISALVVGKNKTKFQALNLSLAYVLGMALSYAMLGSLSGVLGGFLNLQTALQSAWVLVPFAILFVVLSLPLFGVFELQLPSSWQEKIISRQNKISGKGGLITTVIIGFLAALVVSPCLSAPLVAALSFVAQSGNAGLGGLALFASGLGMGVPLIIFATLGATYLPKSGLWMEKVKNIFGIAMLFMAIYMLRLWLSSNLILLLSGALLFAAALIIYTKNRMALIASVLIGIYSLALIIGGLMGNSSFLTPLQIGAGGNSAEQELSAIRVLQDGQNSLNDANKTNGENTKDWIRISSTEDLDRILQSGDAKNLVLISAQWCANCKIVEKQILNDADLVSASGDWNLIKLDTTNPDEKMRKFLQSKNIFGPPSFLFYEGTQELANLRLQGIIDKLEIIKRLEF